MKFLISFIFILNLFGFCSQSVLAQFVEGFGEQGIFKKIRGQIQAGDESPVVGATISATNIETEATVIVESDENGNFKLAKLSDGKYDFRVEANGFNIAEFSAILNSKNSKALSKFIVVGLSPGCASGGFGVILVEKIKK